MWKLTVARKPEKFWEEVGTFESLSEAARCILELDGSEMNGVFFEFHVLPPDSDDVVLSEFQYTGKDVLFYVKRVRH